jgi:hypothetical protein
MEEMRNYYNFLSGNEGKEHLERSRLNGKITLILHLKK